MKQKLFAVLLAIGSACAFGQSILQDQNTNAWGKNGAISGAPLKYPDIKGTITNQFEVLVTGTAPATLTITVVGCMRGGTCSATLATSSGTTNQLLTPTSSNIYDYYSITTTWTGGDATTNFVVNRTGTVARLPSGSTGASYPGVVASQFGAKENVQYRSDASTTSTTTITCPDCNFQSADAGKQIWGVLANGTLVLGSTVAAITISSVTNSTTVIASSAALSTNSGNVTLLWGTDDTTALANAWTVAQTPGFNTHCQPLHISGISFISAPLFNAVSAACQTAYNNPSVVGDGKDVTILVPTPNFNYTSCNPACLGGYIFTIFTGWSAYGFFYDSPNCPGNTQPLVENNGGFITGMDIQGWCTGSAATVALLVTGTGAGNYFGGVEDSGGDRIGTDTGAGILVQAPNAQFYNFVDGGGISNPFHVINTTGVLSEANFNKNLLVLTGGSMTSINDFAKGSTAIINGSVRLLGSTFNPTNLTLGPGADVEAKDSTFQQNSGGAAIIQYNTSQFSDDGGNTFTSGIIAAEPPQYIAAASGTRQVVTTATDALSITNSLNGYSYLVLFNWTNTTTNSGCSDGTNTYTAVGAGQVTGSADGTARGLQLYKIVSNAAGASFTITCTAAASNARMSVTAIAFTEADQTTFIDNFTAGSQIVSGSGTAVTCGAQTLNTASDAVALLLGTDSSGTTFTQSGIAMFNTVTGASNDNEVFFNSGATPGYPINTGYTISGTFASAVDWVGYCIQLLARTPSGTPMVRSQWSSRGTRLAASNVAYTSGWGTSPPAVIVAPLSDSLRMLFTLTAGTTPGANPVFTVTFPKAFQIPPQCTAQQVGGTQAGAFITTGTVTTTTAPFTWVGTPTGANTIQVLVRCD